jgi:cob(I)alamin adenosyltransferase
MKIYTKTGDRGETSLYGGQRRSKADPRIASYGEVDEVQAALGVAAAYCAQEKELADITQLIQEIQHDGFVLCAMLACPAGMVPPKGSTLAAERVGWLESAIDRFETEVPPLRSFIMQGGSLAGSHLHLARAICRRAERSLVALADQEEVAAVGITYLNRLSDLLFVLARVANHRQSQPEFAWKAEK